MSSKTRVRRLRSALAVSTGLCLCLTGCTEAPRDSVTAGGPVPSSTAGSGSGLPPTVSGSRSTTLPTEETVELSGIRVRLPAGWVADYRQVDYVQAGDDRDRENVGTNLIVVSSVLDANGVLRPAPKDVVGWLRAYPGMRIVDLGTLQVDGVTGRRIRLEPDRSRTLWCPQDSQVDRSGCFNTGAWIVYRVVPFRGGTLLVELGAKVEESEFLERIDLP